MKTENNVMYIVRLAGTLLLIAAVVAALLAGVNMVTAPIIEQLNYEKTQAAINAVLPGGGEEIAFTDDTGMVAKVYKSEKGYAVQVQPAGFDGTIDMMVGIDHEGKILGGGVMLGAIFMATDYVTSPITKLGQIIYGIGCGALTVLIRYFGGYNEGVSYAILCMNACVVLLDRIGRPVKFGAPKKEAAK